MVSNRVFFIKEINELISGNGQENSSITQLFADARETLENGPGVVLIRNCPVHDLNEGEAKKLLDKIKRPGDEVIYRDLDNEMVFVTGLTESGMNIDIKDQNENHKKMFELSNQLVSELKESDIIIISAPIYNYGPPATLKAWSDLAARVGETFRFKPNGRREGLLKNKKAYLVITSGGTKLNSNEDFLTPWLKFILNFFGIDKVETISADQMALDYEKSIKDAHTQIDKITS